MVCGIHVSVVSCVCACVCVVSLEGEFARGVMCV